MPQITINPKYSIARNIRFSEEQNKTVVAFLLRQENKKKVCLSTLINSLLGEFLKLELNKQLQFLNRYYKRDFGFKHGKKTLYPRNVSFNKEMFDKFHEAKAKIDNIEQGKEVEIGPLAKALLMKFLEFDEPNKERFLKTCYKPFVKQKGAPKHELPQNTNVTRIVDPIDLSSNESAQDASQE